MWEATYRQSVPGSPEYWRFCHTRWLMLASELRARPPPPGAAVAVIDDDVLLFESVETRLREAAASHAPHVHVEVSINGAFVLASQSALQVRHRRAALSIPTFVVRGLQTSRKSS